MVGKDMNGAGKIKVLNHLKVTGAFRNHCGLGQNP
jgi:hypothetical protein